MPSSVYLHDGEKQITVRFPTEEDRERFKAHYRAIDALGVQYREALIDVLEHLPSDEVLSESWQGEMMWDDIFALREIVPRLRAIIGGHGGKDKQ